MSEHVEAAHRRLAMVWIDFESGLAQVPIIARLLGGTLRAEDYRRLLFNLRQQVVDGSCWIARAASSLGAGHEQLRSLFMRHAATEHRDYQLLERNYAAAGGDIEAIRHGERNIGTEALSAFMFHAASRPDPLGLLGAMFVIEGLGHRLARDWADRIAEQTGLGESAFTFLRYHGEEDGGHLAMFDEALALAATGGEVVDDIVRHARVVARLYRLQLEELDHV